MTFHFGNVDAYHAGWYDEWNDPSSHLIECQTLWASQPKDEWVHSFVHTLDEMPRSWYVLPEFHKEITTWEELTVFFTHTFSFTDTNPDVHNALQLIRDVVLKVMSVAYLVDPHVHCHMQALMDCYNVTGGLEDGDDLRNINIPEIEGSQDVTASDVLTDPMN